MNLLGLALVLASVADWTPARWNSADPKSLELVRQTPINCLLIDERNWSAEFNRAAAEAGIATLAVGSFRRRVFHSPRFHPSGTAPLG